MINRFLARNFSRNGLRQPSIANIFQSGDSSFQTGERASKVINGLKIAVDDHAVIVTHGGAIVDYFRNIFGDKAVQTLACEYELGQDYQMLHCSINSIEIGDQPLIKRLNYSKHLSAETE